MKLASIETQPGNPETMLVIRLGAMGDILHALPAVASLKLSFPQNRLAWLVGRKWLALLAGNPYIDELIPFDRTGLSSFLELRKTLRLLKPEMAVDLQGLVQSAVAGRMAGATRFFGFDRAVAREPLASMLYSDRVPVSGPHRIERNLQLVRAAGASRLTEETWLPQGVPEGALPSGPYVLASPFAGWNSKQWPLELYDLLGERLQKEGLELVVNVPPDKENEVSSFRYMNVHSSSLAGLIYATRHAAAVLGVDSGPMHLAAALKKPGVALFGPTDPAQTGPFRSLMIVLRDGRAETTYKRESAVHASMARISVKHVEEALMRSLRAETDQLKTVGRTS